MNPDGSLNEAGIGVLSAPISGTRHPFGVEAKGVFEARLTEALIGASLHSLYTVPSGATWPSMGWVPGPPFMYLATAYPLILRQ